MGLYGKVPLIKQGNEFFTDVVGMGNMQGEEEKGMSYEDYLRAFILFVPENTLTERFMDILEFNVRKLDANNNFRLDYCFDAWAVTAYVSSYFGYDYRITRTKDLEVN